MGVGVRKWEEGGEFIKTPQAGKILPKMISPKEEAQPGLALPSSSSSIAPISP
jgi:hypothetical protein